MTGIAKAVLLCGTCNEPLMVDLLNDVRETLTKVRSGVYDFRVFMRRLEEESGCADPAT